MDYPKLKKEIKEIAEIAEAVPDAFKEKCFEVLLNHLISGPGKIPPPPNPDRETENTIQNPPPPPADLQVTTQLRVFMQKNGISKDEITTMLIVADEDVHFIREPAHENVATGQVQWALLIALRNCILKNDLTVDPEDVRSVCQEKGFYDASNFATNFKTQKNAKLFKGTMERQGDAQGLTPEGQTELAKLIRQLAAGQE